jgi:hypothetical protein
MNRVLDASSRASFTERDCGGSMATKRAARKSSKRKSTKKSSAKRWSRRVTEHSHALDLESGVFSRSDPKSIARSLKRSAESSQHRKSDPYRSAMSMLSFYINRGGSNLSASRKHKLQSAKTELRRLYHRE